MDETLKMQEEITPKKTVYDDVCQYANKPLIERHAVVQGRQGKMVIPRCYHMSSTKIAEFLTRSTAQGRFVSPFRRGGCYWGIVEALSVLGENKKHQIKDLMAQLQIAMAGVKDIRGKDGWTKFLARPPRNPKVARDPFAKVIQNVEFLQRLGGNHPSAFKLAQLGACVNVYLSEADGLSVELRTGLTDIPRPINERRTRERKKKTINNVYVGRTVEAVE